MRGHLLALLIPAASAPLLANAAESPRPRGVGPEFAKYYKSQGTFSCVSNPTIKIPSTQVNDDYCDCPDGSDEPGTAACAYVHPYTANLASDTTLKNANTTAALPGFYCKNKGHMPTYMPFTFVNDGVCDYEFCCDGSDEYDGVRGVKCPDKCKEIGKEWKLKDEARQKSLSGASKRRKELVTEAGRIRKEVEDRMGNLVIQVQAADVKVKEAEKALAETELRERSRLARGGGKTGKVGVLLGLAKPRVEELREALEKIKAQRDAENEKVKELEQILSIFKEEYNPNFNDEGVKRAVRSWEEYAVKEKSAYGDEASERDLGEVLKADSATEGINWADFETPEEENEVEQLYTITNYLPPSMRTWVDSKLSELRTFLITNGVIAGSSTTPDAGESQAMQTARTAVSTSQNGLRDLENRLNDAKGDLEKDYGPHDGIFRALQGQCVSRDSGEYTYELCWMDKTQQRSKKTHGATNLGNFARFENVSVDDEVPADGKGVGSGQRLAMVYEDGQHCWNGPSRSTLVVLACAEVDEVWKISEEEKCVYRMEVGTSAVCGIDFNRPAAEVPIGVKDEL